MKSAAKSALRSIARALPWGVKQAILDGIVDSLDHFEKFQQLGHGLCVESISVRGANGLVWGSLSDRWLIGNYATRRQWAPNLVELCRQTFSRNEVGGTFLDIGANVGLTLFPVAQNPRVQCFGFEPVPTNFAYLSLGLRENCPHDNVVVRQIALFDRKDTLTIELSPDNSGDHRVKISNTDGVVDRSRKVICVPADRLDDIVNVESLKHPLVAKMDTEGSEPNIFTGGEKTLAAADLLFLEFSPHLMRRIGGDVAAEIDFIEKHFREGAIMSGDQEGVPRWCHVSSIAGELRSHWADSDIGTRYFDVIVKK